MQQHPGDLLSDVFSGIIKHNVTSETDLSLKEAAQAPRPKGSLEQRYSEPSTAQLNLAFASVPRKTGRHPIELTQEEQARLKEIHPQFSINDWTIDRLCRVWLLLQLDSSDKENYFRKLENLFKAAEMNELAALYSALPGFEYPEDWQKQCAEGIRSNIGIVLEAIMYNNPYPYKYLGDQAWNQLVMKAFFTDKDVKRIIGLDERANKELASILIDYANERWAAHRPVDPQLWRLVSKFIDETNFNEIKKAFNSNDLSEKKAAALACFNSTYPLGKQLLEKEQELIKGIIENKIDWNSL